MTPYRAQQIREEAAQIFFDTGRPAVVNMEFYAYCRNFGIDTPFLAPIPVPEDHPIWGHCWRA